MDQTEPTEYVREVVVKDDGRNIYFYTFNRESSESHETKPDDATSGDERAGGEANV